ncbi:MAG TPA: 30S ribosomal protein S17e [Candidatus Bathyarchaeia archaeon]|nr:30S ribosomal protein S17e [Candidatus Bathyarchaeia archaeon]
MNRIKRISNEILERFPENFGTDFDENKAILKKIAVVRSKLLRNRIAGYITSYQRSEKVSTPAETTESEIE